MKTTMTEHRKRYRARYPWSVSYDLAKQRCNVKGKYYKKGIKFEMTLSDFRSLWFRDRAERMARPSIDRIDNAGNYTLNNCRFIENSLNAELGKQYRRMIKKSGHCQ